MLINLLLRNLLHYNQYDQAEKLRAKLTWPEKYSNQQYCRYLYYLGRIRCIELEYSAAKDCLAQATRKAPKVRAGGAEGTAQWRTEGTHALRCCCARPCGALWLAHVSHVTPPASRALPRSLPPGLG